MEDVDDPYELGEEGEEGAVEPEAELEDEPEEAPEAAVPQKKKPDLRRAKKLKALLLSKYDAVLSQTEELGWSVLETEQYEETHQWNVCWSDVSVSLERIMRMGRLQKINHFPGESD